MQKLIRELMRLYLLPGAAPVGLEARFAGQAADAIELAGADGMVRAMKAPPAQVNGETFNLVGEPCLSGGEYLDAFERLAGIKVRRLPVPPWRRFVEDIAKYGLKTVAGAERYRPSYDYYVGMSCRARYSPEKAKRSLGWTPSADPAHLVDRGIAVPVAEFVK